MCFELLGADANVIYIYYIVKVNITHTNVHANSVVCINLLASIFVQHGHSNRQWYFIPVHQIWCGQVIVRCSCMQSFSDASFFHIIVSTIPASACTHTVCVMCIGLVCCVYKDSTHIFRFEL